VDANERHRQAVTEALNPIYRVNAYGDASNAMSGMRATAPQVVLVGQRVGSGIGTNFIKDLRKEGCLADIPVVLIIDSEDIRLLSAIREIGVRDYIVKPYRRIDLLQAIALQINGKVENSWQSLPQKQRKALEGTLNAFNGMIDDLSKGNPISYATVDQSCAAVVEAIGENDVGPIVNSVKEHDNFTYVHSLRVATFLSLFGKAIGLSKDKLILLASGGFLHDVGKLRVPRETLNKVEKLTSADWRLIRGHVALSQRLLAASESIPKAVLTIATQHHERLDGSGYPLALEGKDLNQLTRMAAIIDVFTAMTDRSPYRRTLPAESALELMTTDMGRQLDQELLAKFRSILLDEARLEEPAESR
jgi:HD-GYP domain-containing protein (c-di-GMP phosphodiesterase class II)